MTLDSPDVALVVLVGPQASGKSTVAAALGQELRRQGELVALVELDQIAAMALPSLPSWDIAAHIFASVAGAWARAGLTCVIAEGISSRAEVVALLEQVPAAAIVTVAMTTSFETAVRRAQADPSREMSRDRRWLAERYEEWSAELPRIGADVLIDTGKLSTAGSVALVTAAIHSARSASS